MLRRAVLERREEAMFLARSGGGPEEGGAGGGGGGGGGFSGLAKRGFGSSCCWARARGVVVRRRRCGCCGLDWRALRVWERRARRQEVQRVERDMFARSLESDTPEVDGIQWCRKGCKSRWKKRILKMLSRKHEANPQISHA